MLGAIGDFLPVAMTLALSPFPIIAMVIILGGAGGARAGTAFAIGWVVALALLTAVLVLAVGGFEELDLGLGAGLQILLGLGLFGAAWRKWRGRPRGGAEPALPRWAAALDRVSLPRAAGLGVMLGGVNPKSLALALAAVTVIAERGLTGGRALIAGWIFSALGSVSVIGVLALGRAGGPEGAQRLDALKRFMLRNNNVIMMILFVVIGAKVLGDGLAALGS
jgi:threonine/homoserine/homoserine lactone efflux protein